PALRRYVAAQSAAYAVVFFVGVALYETMNALQRSVWIMVLLGSLYAIGSLLNDSRHARRIERGRQGLLWLLALAILVLHPQLRIAVPLLAGWFGLTSAASAVWLSI